jgi:filamentous hemagglutinin family protein
MIFMSHVLPIDRLLIIGLVLIGLAFQPVSGSAQVATNITSSGLGTVITPNGNRRDITGGTRHGTNLFHSFGRFNVGTGDIANFLNDTGAPTNNILGRVNGGQTSNIFGTIRTTDFGSANLYLINPAGWIFGPTASLHVGGSFHVSTADYIRLNEGGVRFNASGLNDNLLTSAPPAAFGFLGPPASISIDGSSLTVLEEKTLSLVGGDVQITGATLSAPSGRVQIASVASAGEVTMPDLDVGSFSSLGQINISADSNGVTSTIDVSDTSGIGGGSVIIRGNRLIVSQSAILADNFADVEGAPVAVDLQIAEDATLTNGASISATAWAAGRGGDIEIDVGGKF